MKKKPAGDNSKGRKSQKKSNVPKKEGNMEDKEQKRCDSSNEESEREIKKDDQSNESHDKPAPVIKLKRDLTKGEKLISLLKKGNWTVPALQQALNTDSHTLYDLADELAHKGFDIRVIDNKDEKMFFLVKGEDVNDESIPIAAVNKKLKIGFVSEIRMGAKQSQISLLHWIYKEIFERGDVDFVVVLGGLVIGKPTPTVVPDALKTDADSLVEYVIKHYPKNKKFKTYIVSGKAELSWKTKDGFDIVSAICNQRDDLRKAGDMERTFTVRGVHIKTMSPLYDNCPKSVSCHPQGVAEKLKETPMPHLLVMGSIHRRMYFPANGMHVFTVPSLCMQMKRQKAHKVTPYIGCLITELNYKQDWTIDLNKEGLKHDFSRLDDYTNTNDCWGIDLGLAKNLNEEERMVLDWFIKEHAITQGDLSRRLKQNKDSVKKIIKKIEKCGYSIPLKKDSKSYELEIGEKEEFFPSPMKYEDVFVCAEKVMLKSDAHLGSDKDLPDIHRQMYEDGVGAGVTRVFDSGDLTDGAGCVGYKGHVFDGRPGCQSLDGLEDYVVSKWPKDIKIKVDPKKPPVLVTERIDWPDGKIGYKESFVKDGEVILQTDAIEGNHDGWSWKGTGVKLVRQIAIRMDKCLRYLGYLVGATIVNGIYHKLLHPEGGSGSYLSNIIEKTLKKIRESGESNGLPAMVIIGHYHSACYLFDTRIGFRMPCVKDEDVFHETHNLVPYIGMFITEIYLDKSGKNITKVIVEYRNYYPQVKKQAVRETHL